VSDAPLPLLVIGGWLGVGKTTLVNRLLRDAGGLRVAVLVNDFGEVNLDADLVVGADAGVLQLSGGCLCCSFGDDLVGTLRGLAARRPRPQFLLVELSGVALPAAVMRTARLVPEVQVLGALVLADVGQVRGLARDRYVGDTVREQLASAHWLLPSKLDLAGSEQARSACEWLAQAAPRARLLPGPAGALPAELVYGWPQQALAPEAAAPGGGWQRPIGPLGHAQAFASRGLALPAGTDLAAIASRLSDPRHAVLRAKAVVADGAGGGQLLQWTPAHAEVTACAAPAAGHLVVIGTREAVKDWPPGWPVALP
jgi:G3E family GTPase